MYPDLNLKEQYPFSRKPPTQNCCHFCSRGFLPLRKHWSIRNFNSGALSWIKHRVFDVIWKPSTQKILFLHTVPNCISATFPLIRIFNTHKGLERNSVVSLPWFSFCVKLTLGTSTDEQDGSCYKCFFNSKTGCCLWVCNVTNLSPRHLREFFNWFGEKRRLRKMIKTEYWRNERFGKYLWHSGLQLSSMGRHLISIIAERNSLVTLTLTQTWPCWEWIPLFPHFWFRPLENGTSHSGIWIVVL